MGTYFYSRVKDYLT